MSASEEDVELFGVRVSETREFAAARLEPSAEGHRLGLSSRPQMPQIPLKPEYGPTLGQMLDPRWREARHGCAR